MSRKKYTKKIHIKRLVAILSSNRPLCSSCPAAKYYNGNNSYKEFWVNNPCRICAEFIGLIDRGYYNCPCIRLGDEEAYNITMQKLEEEGYIEM